jgi:hypothetical protein
MRHLLLLSLALAACGGGSSSDWLGGKLKTVDGKVDDIAFAIDLPTAMESRPNALGLRSYLSDDAERTFGPWVDVEKAGYTPRSPEDVTGYVTEGATVVAKEQRPDGAWLMAAIKKDAPSKVHVRLWRTSPGKTTLVCDAKQEAEKTIADPEKVRARFEQICSTLRYK